jgi:hypothetical protein
LSGTYRIPEVARPLLRAALLDHQIRGLPVYALLLRDARRAHVATFAMTT